MNKLQRLEIIRDRILETITISDILNLEGVKTRGNRCKCILCNSNNKTTLGFDRLTFNCFKCGTKGQVVDLVMQIHNLAFEEALKKINHDFCLGLEFDRELEEWERNKWEQAKQEREKQKQLLLDEEKRTTDLVEYRQELWKQGKEGYNFIDRVLDNEPAEVIKHLGIKQYRMEDFE